MVLIHKQGVKGVGSVFGAAAVLGIFVAIVMCAYVDAAEVSHWKGQEVFKSKGCAHCHAVYGNNGKGGPDLGEKKFYGTYLELAARMWNHFPRMYKQMGKTNTEFPEISIQEMEQLIAYLSFIRYRGEPGNDYKGQELIRERCSVCHRYRGKGGDIGPDFDDLGDYVSSMQLVEAMWNHGPDMMEIFREHDIKRPTFKGRDIEHVLAALRTPTTKVPPGTFTMGDPVKGKRLFEEKGCAHCHAYRGVGGTVGPDFADVDLDYSAAQIGGKMWNHGPKMWELMEKEQMKFATFESGEMADVVAYLYSLKLEDDPGNPDRGHRMINDRGCLQCHSLRGEGATISKDLSTLEDLDSPLAMIAAMWNHAPGMREKQVEKKMKWPKLKAEDMADLYAYLYQTTHGTDEGE